MAGANRYQFGPGQVLSNGPVGSVMVLWCRRGTGKVRVNGSRFTLVPNDFLILPWNHRVAYAADRKEPFQVAAVHVIPRHAQDVDPVFDVPHVPGHPLEGDPSRVDEPIDGVEGVVSGKLTQTGAFPGLLDYIIDRFVPSPPPVWQARQMGQWLLRDIEELAGGGLQKAVELPPELQQMQLYVLSHLDRAIHLDDLAELVGRSRSTVGRLFRTHLGCSPVTWILTQKMNRAAQLLRTRNLNVNETAVRVGIPDPSYFTRCFTRIIGQKPLVYKQRHAQV